MRALSSLTRTQWLVIIGLELAAVALYLGVIPWLILSTNAAPSPTVELSAERLSTETPPATLKPTIKPSPTIRLAQPSPTASSTRAHTATSTPMPAPTFAPTLAPARADPSAWVALVLNPHVALASKTTFFTSACFGNGANPLQDRDYMAPADWSGSPDRKCIFGYDVNPIDGQPAGRYSVSGGADGQPHFYLVPPEAFAKDPQSIKMLSELQIIVDPDQGCASLGFIGITADGVYYQTPACAFLRAGGILPNADGSRNIVLPTNANNILDPSSDGGAYGFLAFPAVVFRKGFSLYFTGRAGYAPPRVWFESIVDTLQPNTNVETTAQMTTQEVKQIVAQFDRSLSGIDPKSQLAALERDAQLTSPSPVTVKSKQAGAISFATTPGAVLSSVSWRITPLNNQDSRQFLETNICLDLDGKEDCFTGVEDFAHCAFFTPCITGYSSLMPVDHGGYVATRYFPAGTAPIIRDGKVTATFQAPDTGATLEMDVQVRVRDVNLSP